MIDFSMRRAGAVACAVALSSVLALTSMPAQAGDDPGVWQDLREARQEFRADNRDLRREFRVERREDAVDWRNGEYDGPGEFARDRAGDRRSARQQHRIDRRDFRQDVWQILN